MESSAVKTGNDPLVEEDFRNKRKYDAVTHAAQCSAVFFIAVIFFKCRKLHEPSVELI